MKANNATANATISWSALKLCARFFAGFAERMRNPPGVRPRRGAGGGCVSVSCGKGAIARVAALKRPRITAEKNTSMALKQSASAGGA